MGENIMACMNECTRDGEDPNTICSKCQYNPKNKKFTKFCKSCFLASRFDAGDFSSDPDDPTDYLAESMQNQIFKVATIKIDEDNNFSYQGDFWLTINMNEETRKTTNLSLENFAMTRKDRQQTFDMKDMQFKQDADRVAEPLYNYEKVEKTENPLVFLIKHKIDPSKDRTCQLIWQGRQKKTFEWKGLPKYIKAEIQKFNLTDMRKNPQFCLAFLLQQAKDEMETLRPLEDLQ